MLEMYKSMINKRKIPIMDISLYNYIFRNLQFISISKVNVFATSGN